MFKFASIPLFAACLCGCHSGGDTPAQKTNYVYEDADAAKAAKSGQPFEDPSKVSDKAITKAQLVTLEGQQAKLAKQLAENPKDDGLKKQFIEMTDGLGQAEMNCDELTPHEKYSSALKYYHQVLKVDPKDAEANKWVDQIVAVYKSMGRPVPQ